MGQLFAPTASGRNVVSSGADDGEVESKGAVVELESKDDPLPSKVAHAAPPLPPLSSTLDAIAPAPAVPVTGAGHGAGSGSASDGALGGGDGDNDAGGDWGSDSSYAYDSDDSADRAAASAALGLTDTHVDHTGDLPPPMPAPMLRQVSYEVSSCVRAVVLQAIPNRPQCCGVACRCWTLLNWRRSASESSKWWQPCCR